MSVEFRQRTPGEYLKIISRRKWLIILPAIAVTLSVAWVVYRLPDVYESGTLIVVTPSTLPNSVVPTVTEEGLTRQLTTIAQVVTSRSSLEPLVEKYDLYKIERSRGAPMETIIEMMRKDISVEVNTSRNDITNGFNIRYFGRNPRTTQAVTSELAGKYISEHKSNTVNNNNSAKQFIDTQVAQAKEGLDATDKQRLDFMQKNVGNLPSEAAALLGQLNGLREQQKAVMADIGRLQDRRSSTMTEISTLKRQFEDARMDVAENTTDPKTTLAWAELVKRKADLESDLQHLLAELKPKHPDVIAKQAQLDSVSKQMDQMVAEWKERIKEKENKLKNRPDAQTINAENQLKMIESEIKRQQGILDDTEKQITLVTARINSVPGAEVALGALEREYLTKKAAYDQLLLQQGKITLGADAASQQQGEGIEVVDPANLPSQPVAPKRLMLSLIGLAAGLGFGLFLTGVFEIPRLLTIQNTEDARHYTGLPVLLSVPELLTPQEAIALPRRRRLLLAAAAIATVVSIPLLTMALRFTHIFEILSSSSGRPA
jgi:protein tyrosine kinase modulator